MIPTESQVLGKDASHLIPVPECGGALRLLTPEAADAFVILRDQCKSEGIDLAIASSYRSYQQQLTIWNEKFIGKRPLLDRDGRLVDTLSLPERARVFAILTWSAIPGASRHHWGSDLDVYDLAAIPAEYQLKLIPDEYQPDGPFAKLGAFLDSSKDLMGFKRPYLKGASDVAFEPWHLSHVNSAAKNKQVFTLPLFKQHVLNNEILGKQTILENLEQIWQRYIAVD